MQALELDRTLTELDHVRIKNLIRRDLRDRLPAALTQQIEVALDSSAVVPAREVPPDVVTMYSQVMLLDQGSGERTKLALCYPADAEPAAGFISVLSPLGLSLLGLRVGDVARWRTPAGERAAEVLEILFQPEASGDYSL
ncbi:MAG: GreA/GreB family elongation factor [Burkholderiaceae bacterium]|nr:GreA/GreB family elongation factor [Ideonella sp.]MCC7284859.1 GreA/GreB family elongation factor [Burkholderiaceae bacterium]